jgi:predicted DNA-binding transcriptional regulator YafY
MTNNQDTLYRQWNLLRNVPRYPQKRTAKEIAAQLLLGGFEVSERTVQRDLIKLSSLFALVVDDREKPYGWSWQKDTQTVDLLGLTISEALVWVLVEQQLSSLLPGSVLSHLNAYFKSAHGRLDGEPLPHHGRSWLSKVRTGLPTQQLIPPDIDTEVQYIVSEALLHEQQLLLHYRKKGEEDVKCYTVHPLALIQRGSIIYLYVRFAGHDNARLLAMHRIDNAKILPDAAQAPEGFDLDRQIEQGLLGFGQIEPEAVTLKFFNGFGEHLHETKLSKTQSIFDEAQGVLTISAVVSVTPQFKWWLLGFGDNVEVMAPESLRHTLSDIACKMHARYQKPANLTNET